MQIPRWRGGLEGSLRRNARAHGERNITAELDERKSVRAQSVTFDLVH